MPEEVGNALLTGNLKNGENTGWFVGNYIKQGLRRTDKFEVKWYCHPKGQESGEKPPADALTISVLVSGRFCLWFRDNTEEDWRERILSHEGDYAIWDAPVHHKWKSLEESVVVTVRPGKPFHDMKA